MIKVALWAQTVQRLVKSETEQQRWWRELYAWDVLAQPTTISDALTVHLNHPVHHMYDEFSPYVLHPALLHTFHRREEQTSNEKQRVETLLVQQLIPLLKQANS